MCTDYRSEQGWKKCPRHWNEDCPAAHGEDHTRADHYNVSPLRDAMLRAGMYVLNEAAQADYLWPVREPTPN